MAKTHSQEGHSHQAKISRRLRKFLSHMIGGYMVKATLRAEEAKGFHP
jgi:hypothetical protein